MKLQNKILIVDDSELNRSLLADMLRDEYEVLEAENGLQAIKILEFHQFEISLILLDIIMPEMDGFEVLAMMNKNGWIERIPVIIISAETTAAYIDAAYDLGATEYVNRPFDPKTIRRRVSNTIMLYSKQKYLENAVTEQVLEKEKSNLIMVEVLSHIVEFRNGESGMHVLNIRTITEMLLTQLCASYSQYNYLQSQILLIANASSLHDIGKISIDENILNKPGKLTHEEYEKMKVHSSIGANMLERTRYYPNEEIVRIARDICRWHHERYDGKGYPDGLAGDEIPIEAQVVSLADVYDALTHKRIYKEAYSHQKAFELIFSGQCGAFNPLLLQCMKEIGPMLEKELKTRSFGYVTKEEIKELTRNILQYGEASNRTLALLEQERIKYQFIAEMSKEILFEYTYQTDVLTLSEEGVIQLGLPEIIVNLKEDKRFRQVMKVEDFKDLRSKIRCASPGSPTVMENYCLCVNGHWRWFKIIVRPLWLGNNTNAVTGAIGKCTDVHEEVMELELLKKKAHIDDLTGLYRRNYACAKIKELLKKEHSDNKKYALMLFDLDFFKNANDLYGHMFGDQVLREAVQKVRNSVRNTDIVARIGGDEFLIFIEYKADISSAADRIFQSIGGMYQDFHICASMGVALSPVHATEYELLFHFADQALYAAKHKGRNCYCIYDDTMDSFLSVISDETPYEEEMR
ncbi:diguanylate cyclase [Clostridium sp. MCC353]|uniref:bifunctional diguanylate cyclase/phosphohydrolase n=1 Tax=Clostridium sp. MCC353 TaxID=2592646 RepID=UPI001C02C256|nr:diguanylate cyclase [Clostridium sp. MCC353]MBT9775120.1 diguanylate cyclase [Clostridium sp. MCC353]